MRKKYIGLISGSTLVPLLFAVGCGQKPTEVKNDDKANLGLRTPAKSADYQAPDRDVGLTPVTSTYGPLFVSEGKYKAEASRKPWSSWWYPIKDPYLFQGTGSRLSPLEKYDLYMHRSRNAPSVRAASFEKANLYEPNADGWEGLCDAWALAAIVEPEPDKPLVLDGIQFDVADLKALLIKMYEVPEGLTQFGQRNNATSSSIYEDIYPDQFHRFLQVELFDKHRAFIMDKDAGVAVWNTPIWKSYSKIVGDANQNVLHVTTWLVGADPHVDDYNFVGTREVNFEYTYDLFGNRQPDGRFLVSYGKWTGPSINDHPDFFTSAPEKVSTRSRNLEIRNEEVQRILGR